MHVDSVWLDSVVQVEGDEELTIGTAYSTRDITTCSTIEKRRDRDLESAVEIVNDGVDEGYDGEGGVFIAG